MPEMVYLEVITWPRYYCTNLCQQFLFCCFHMDYIIGDCNDYFLKILYALTNAQELWKIMQNKSFKLTQKKLQAFHNIANSNQN